MIDTHCHITFDDYRGQVDGVLRNAAKRGVTGAITVSTSADSALRCLAMANERKNVWCTSGVHPLYAEKAAPQGPHDWAIIRNVASSPRCVAWGELGLDNHYKEPAKESQLKVLHEQLELIESSLDQIDKPIVLHCRKAFSELIPILEATSLDPTKFVFHCFTGSPDDMRMLLDFGAMVSITGVVTYKNAPEVREAVQLAPLDRIMVETDCPFLAPEPHRKVWPNEPAFARDTAEFIADLRGESWDEFHNAINRNTERFYGIPNVS